MVVAIDLYQAAYLEAYIAPVQQDALEDAERKFLHESAAPGSPSFTPVPDLLMPFKLLTISAAQKIDDFWQHVFSTMVSAKPFFSEGDDVVMVVSIARSRNILASSAASRSLIEDVWSLQTQLNPFFASVLLITGH